MTSRPRLCRFFTTPAGCRHGDSCRYVHEDSGVAHTQSDQNDRRCNSSEAEFQQWKFMVPRDQQLIRASKLGPRLSVFFSHALKFVEQDAGTRQEVITRLASEGGLLRIGELVDTVSQNQTISITPAVRFFDDIVSPLLQTLAHDGVISSLILERDIYTISNFIFGPGGQRSKLIFSFIVRAIAWKKERDTSAISTQFSLQLEACLKVFWNIINTNSSALVDDEFQMIAKKLADELKCIDVDDSNWSCMRAKGFMVKVQRRLCFGQDISNAADARKALPQKAVFKLTRDPPGWLSDQGPRHDNDFENFTEIKIMPTAQEIHSARLEYLPTTDAFGLHVLGVQGLLDRQFRLLREDTVGQLRDAVKFAYDQHFSLKPPATTRIVDKTNTRTYTYANAEFCDLQMHKFRGLDIMYTFDQPHRVRSMTQNERKNWWESSKRLQEGALICLLDSRGTPIFCSVSDNGTRKDVRTPTAELPIKDTGSVFKNPLRASVTFSLVESNISNIDTVLGGFISGGGRGSEIIVEFPGVLLPSFRPTLQALQRMALVGDMPFNQIFAPLSRGEVELREVLAPAYSLQPGFRFDLDCLTNGAALSLSTAEKFDVVQLQTQSTLDEKQAIALVDALSHNFALIQGPPGTGKSYTGVAIIKVLLPNAKKARLGPIITVCYTNHALDQLLEHLVDHGVDQLIRVGSRSKSEILENVSLRAVAGRMEATKTEKQKLGKLIKESDKYILEINELLQQFQTADTSAGVQAFLQTHYPFHASELFSGPTGDEEGFIEVRYGTYNPLKDWLETRHAHPSGPAHVLRPIDVLQFSSLKDMVAEERRALYAFWISEARSNLKNMIEKFFYEYMEVKSELELARQERDLRCLEQAKVIGVTTSGLARIVDLLSRLGSKVVICEEAGEVLEAHTLTTLLPSIEHAILIGDHLQLRPQIQNYNLSNENPSGHQFSLDVSLFERLVTPAAADEELPAIPFSTLQTQRRMHPLIADLIRSTLYPTLQDALSVRSYPQVFGMRKRLFWYDHLEPELIPESDTIMATSHANNFEVSMTAALVLHLVRQGKYHSQDIAVLTPYLGQLRRLREELAKAITVTINDRDHDEMEKQGFDVPRIDAHPITKTTLLKALRLATVDNFQGEEAKVVVISLVRSNKSKKCGFLRTPNRINVLLSRAQHGMYIIGNAETSSHVPMWAEVLKILENGGNFGTSLELCCPRHPETPIAVTRPEDFSKLAPEGGCLLKCDKRLECGHQCAQRCHADHLHEAVRCLESCHRSIPGCDVHICPNVCGDACPKECPALISDVGLPCGHSQDLTCHASKNLASVACQADIAYTVPVCHHKILMKCCSKDDASLVSCTAKCGSVLACGHQCMRACTACRTTTDIAVLRIDHGQCQHICGRPSTTCAHSCSRMCHGSNACGLCEAQCGVRCAHSACKKQCYEPCTPCAEQHCTSTCPHNQCDMPCAVPCNWIPCSKRCKESLECGHQCPTVCGERCVDRENCQSCCSIEKKNSVVDFILGQTYGETNLDEDPCIFPHCGHIVAMSSMDGHVDMGAHYYLSEGRVIDIKLSSHPFSSSTDMKRCPMCRGSLRDIARYGRIVRRALLDESTKRLHVWSHTRAAELESQLRSMEERFKADEFTLSPFESVALIGSRNEQIHTIRKIEGLSNILKEELKLYSAMRNFARTVRREEQPFQRVWDMIQDIKRRRGSMPQHIPDDIQTVQMSYSISASILTLRWELALMSKLVSTRNKSNKLELDLTSQRQECLALIASAEMATLPLRQIEGHLLFARFGAIQRLVPISSKQALESPLPTDPAPQSSSRNKCVKDSLLHLEMARELCNRNTSKTERYLNEVDQIERMLLDAFYVPVSSSERHSILAAMANEFRGSGHWYYCANDHPFTIGECGMPMQEAACPECGASVGGQNHAAVAGTSRAEDLERELRGLRIGA